MPGLVVLGGCDFGTSILRHFVADGWQAAMITDWADGLEAARAAGFIALDGDPGEPESLRLALGQAGAALDGIAVIVNAPGAALPEAGEPFGGGAVADASLEQYRRWGTAHSEAAFVFLSEGARMLREAGDGGTLVQITGEAARRVTPRQGPWASG